MDRPIRPNLDWRIVAEHRPVDFGVFRVLRHDAAHPDTGAVRTFSVIESTDWVNCVAITPADELVLVRQYRHGTRRQTIEIPGGVVDPGESPLEAARRELREETGHEAAHWALLGVVEPNPAIQKNRCFTYLGLDAQKVTEMAPDAGEVLSVELCPLAAVPDLVRSGQITHSLVIAAFYHWLAYAGGWRRPDKMRSPGDSR